MTVGGRKLAVVKATMNAEVRVVWIVGLKDDQFVRVTRLRSSNDDITLFSGECATKITVAFGVSVRP